MNVSDLMTPKPTGIKASEDLAVAYELMNEKFIRHLPVVDDQGDLVGLVTHRDLANSVLSVVQSMPGSEQQDYLASNTVSLVMTTAPETIAPETPLADAARLILENKFGCLPVVEGNKLVGILTESDFVKYTLNQLDN